MRQKLGQNSGQKMRQLLMLTMLFSSVGLSGQMFSAQNASVESTDTNTYVVIGTQTWMKYNLKVTKYNDGAGIPKVTDNAAWAALTTPAYCWYNNDSITYHSPYGALYNWYAVNTGNICPTGWHEPSATEWATLSTYLGGNTISGGHLKETGTAHWDSPNTSADNSSGFTAVPGGRRYGPFYDLFSSACFWTSTQYDATDANEIGLRSYSAETYPNYYHKWSGRSVRCIKD